MVGTVMLFGDFDDDCCADGDMGGGGDMCGGRDIGIGGVWDSDSASGVDGVISVDCGVFLVFISVLECTVQIEPFVIFNSIKITIPIRYITKCIIKIYLK
jgi:hypothetical protein